MIQSIHLKFILKTSLVFSKCFNHLIKIFEVIFLALFVGLKVPLISHTKDIGYFGYC